MAQRKTRSRGKSPQAAAQETYEELNKLKVVDLRKQATVCTCILQFALPRRLTMYIGCRYKTWQIEQGDACAPHMRVETYPPS